MRDATLITDKKPVSGEAVATEPAPELRATAVFVELPSAQPARGKKALLGSVGFHVLLVLALVYSAKNPSPRVTPPVKIKIIQVEKPKPPVAEVKPAPPPPPKPEPQKKKPKNVTTERQPPKPPAAKVVPVQGVSPDALVPGGHGIAAKVGNTLMTEDDGKQHTNVQPMAPAEDKSADAQLIDGTVVVPKYTDTALDANLEGAVTVDVYVDDKGTVVQADLRKKLGYGMDERILSAARQARFHPRTDKNGRPLPGWTEIRFRLEIPG